MRCDADEDVGDADDHVGDDDGYIGDYVAVDDGDAGDEDHLDPPLDGPLPVEPAPLSFDASSVIFHVALPNCCLALFSLPLVVVVMMIMVMMMIVIMMMTVIVMMMTSITKIFTIFAIIIIIIITIIIITTTIIIATIIIIIIIRTTMIHLQFKMLLVTKLPPPSEFAVKQLVLINEKMITMMMKMTMRMRMILMTMVR